VRRSKCIIILYQYRYIPSPITVHTRSGAMHTLPRAVSLILLPPSFLQQCPTRFQPSLKSKKNLPKMDMPKFPRTRYVHFSSKGSKNSRISNSSAQNQRRGTGGCQKRKERLGGEKLINGSMPSHLPNQPHGKPGSARFNDNQPDSAAGKTLSSGAVLVDVAAAVVGW